MRYSYLALFISVFLFSHKTLGYSFDPKMLDGKNNSNVDISLFNKGLQLPGKYNVSIWINDEPIEQRDVNFKIIKDKLYPCISEHDLRRYGVDVNKYSGILSGNKYDSELREHCVDINAISQADVVFDFNQQKLSIIVPQQAMLPKQKGIAPKESWDDGLPALLLNYQANSQHLEYRKFKSSFDSQYIQLQPGLNVGPWRIRNSTTWQQNDSQKNNWETLYTYAERGMKDLKSRLTLGEKYSSGDIFESTPFRGIMIATDDNMTPYEQRSFAPVVRGIARTQARVEVKQNGYVITEVSVPAGVFEITDLTTTGSSGDLQVTVWETDGSRHDFSVPYSSPALALHKGYFKYSFTTGQYRPANNEIKRPIMGVAEAMYGLPWNLTIYGGVQGAEHYLSGAFGFGSMLGDLGAVSIDSTYASSKMSYNNDYKYGSRWRLRYNKNLDVGTNIGFVSEEFTSKGFNTLVDTLDTWCNNTNSYGQQCSLGSNKLAKKKSKQSITVSQPISSWGYLGISGARETYWGNQPNIDTYNISYNTTLWENISFNLSWNRNRNTNINGKKYNDSVTSLWVSVPLERWLRAGNSAYATYQLTSPSQGHSSHEFGAYGDALDRKLHWDIRERIQNGRDNDRTINSLNINYKGTYGELGGNYNYSHSQRQMGGYLKGTMLFTSESGLVMGQQQGDTLALVSAKGVSGAEVNHWPGVTTDFRGYTITGYLQPYQKNSININPVSLSDDVSLPQTEVSVVPTEGAIVLAKYPTRVGSRILLKLTDNKNKPLPFGAIVNVENKNNANFGVIGDYGEVYLTGISNKDIVNVRWGNGINQNCVAQINITGNKDKSGVYRVNSTCE